MPERMPLVLVPGLACTAELYGPQTAKLTSPDQVVSVADHTASDTMVGIAAAILAAAPARFALAGLSMGGYICFEMWRQAPDRITKLALLDTQARADTPASADVRRRMIELGEEGRLDKIHAALWPRLVAPNRYEDGALETVVRRMLDETGAAGFVRQQHAILGRVDSRPALASISVPALVVVGDVDQITPPELAQEMAAAIAGSTLVVVPGSGHLSTLEQPSAVTQALAAWLAR